MICTESGTLIECKTSQLANDQRPISFTDDGMFTDFNLVQQKNEYLSIISIVFGNRIDVSSSQNEKQLVDNFLRLFSGRIIDRNLEHDSKQENGISFMDEVCSNWTYVKLAQ